ncbi:hypothetical protein UMM65_01080 [Aureibaculum sp. 2210JD6-5]|uniref:hypothetical protein n=1 Tax=Aureibaculum sp. 2210JD6-5 TaxID=3103957 RepID=UPI002AAE5C75|nr:hypothetical protein [Aureibaculum sp. 2210JD6-5]MDY7393823.1 hypothetical protein [Aureibaculum sp. 2210JD6-5]
MKRILFTCFLLTSVCLFSQNDDKPNFWDNVQFGGGLGLSFSNNYTTIAIAPSAVYNFNQYFAAGPGLSYLYAKNRDLNLKSNVFGAGLITLFNPIQNLQLSAEYEHLFVNQKQGFDKFSFDYPALYAGLAYRVGNFSAGLRYDILYNADKTIYASAFSPIFRFYF